MPEIDIEIGAKRTNTYDEYGEINSFKKVKTESLKLRMLLVGRYCGAIIGKGGENISRLRTQYNVDVNMPATRTIDRVFTIEGNLDNCIGVVKEVLPHCSQAPYPVNQKCTLEMNVLVQSDAIGTVIGKGGSKIKEIREQSNAKIKVYQDCLPNSNERVISIGGDDDSQITFALAIIMNTLKDQPRRSAPIYYDPADKPSEILGVGGLSGSGITNVWGNESVDGGMGASSGGYSNMSQRPMSMAQPLVQHNVHLNTNRGVGDSHQGNTDSDNSDFLQLNTVTSITVPNDMCGAIIGKAGVRIREIRNTSGAKVNFTESDKESKEDRIITITGTQQQVQLAEQLMTQCVRNRTN